MARANAEGTRSERSSLTRLRIGAKQLMVQSTTREPHGYTLTQPSPSWPAAA